jgi:hypothetical protein
MDTPFTTISLCSDGMYFYWVWMPGVITDRMVKSPPVFLDVFRIEVSGVFYSLLLGIHVCNILKSD